MTSSVAAATPPNKVFLRRGDDRSTAASGS
jgi:hypothetical protein